MSIRPGYRFADWYIFANPEGFLQSVRATNILHSPISGGSDRETIDLYTVNEEYGPDDVIALMARAEEYGMQKQTTLALADWISVIKLEPENENAYFEAVKCYYKLAEYSDAVDMLEHCLKLTKGTEYIHAEELKKLLEKSITLRDSFHIDPVATLPYDVLDLIFSLLPFKSRVQCASVSFSWRSFFHNWAGIWQVLDFDGLGMSGSKMLRYTKDANEKGLQRLSMNRADPITVQGIFEALVEKPNPHLIHLEIDNTFLPKEFSTTITSIGRNLTYLYIFWGLALSDLINNVLPSCPNLTHFGADYCAEEITNKPVVFTDTTFRLTHLFLNLLPGPCLKVYTLREFFACCPKLVTLDFVSEKYHLRDFAYSLIKPCPELENIYFQNAHGYRPRKSWKYRNKTTNNYGLIRLEIVMDHKFNEKALWGILSHHHATLKSIKLYQCDGLGGVSGELCGGSYQLSQLHELYIDNCEHFHPTILQNLLLSCSSLKHLHLVNIDAADDILAQVVAPALRLETLEISHCRKMTVRGLELWIKPNRETLKEVILRSCSISSDAIGLAMEESEKRVEIKGSRYYFH